MSRCAAEDAAVKVILAACSDIAKDVGPIELSRLLMQAGLRLMGQARGKAEAREELRLMVARAAKRSQAARDRT